MTGSDWYPHKHGSKLFQGFEFFYWSQSPQYPKPLSIAWLLLGKIPGKEQSNAALYVGIKREGRDFDSYASRKLYQESKVPDAAGRQLLLDWAAENVATPMELLSRAHQRSR